MILRGEETLNTRRRDVLLDGLRIQPIAGNRYRVIVDVGREDLQLYVSLRYRDRLEEEHGDRVGFLARTASGVPDADRLVQRLPAYRLGNDLLRQDRESLFVAENSGDVYQHGFGKEIDLVRILADRVQIDTDVLDRRHRHPPFDLAQERALLVEGEIVRGARAQEVDDHVQPGIGAVAQRWFCALWFGVRLAAEFDEGRRDLGDWKHEISGAGHDSAARHTVVGGILRILHNNEPALVLYCHQPEAAVGAGARQNRADGSFAAIFSKRTEEEIEGHARTVPLARFRELKRACADRKIDPRRDEIDLIALDRHVLRRLQHLHRSVAGQKTDHHALVRRIEMLNQDEGHAGVGRKGVEELVESLQSPCRSAETDHPEVVGPGRSLSLSRSASARPQPGLLSPA